MFGTTRCLLYVWHDMLLTNKLCSLCFPCLGAAFLMGDLGTQNRESLKAATPMRDTSRDTTPATFVQHTRVAWAPREEWERRHDARKVNTGPAPRPNCKREPFATLSEKLDKNFTEVKPKSKRTCENKIPDSTLALRYTNRFASPAPPPHLKGCAVKSPSKEMLESPSGEKEPTNLWFSHEPKVWKILKHDELMKMGQSEQESSGANGSCNSSY